jgi:hypothetical protein
VNGRDHHLDAGPWVLMEVAAMESVQERVSRAHGRWTAAVMRAHRARRSIRGSRLLIDSSRVVLVRPNGLLRGGSDAAATFATGQPVRRLDRPDVGVVVGVLFGRAEKVIVRWIDEVTFELSDDLIEVGPQAT